jgi:branched-chain amino acid transport system permease protein
LFLIAVGLLVAGGLWWFQERTRLGTMLRAGVDDAEIARALGINVSLLFTLVFAVGAGLAALAGVLAGPVLSLYPGADFEVLIFAFVVVVIGGLGSLRGALAGALLVGILDDFGKAFFPQFALFTVFVPMAAILVMRPTGLFGRQ